MTNLTKYLGRYYSEEEVFFIFKLHEGSGKHTINTNGILLHLTDTNEVTGITISSESTHNDLMSVLTTHSANVLEVLMLPLYKLHIIKQKCFVLCPSDNKTYSF